VFHASSLEKRFPALGAIFIPLSLTRTCFFPTSARLQGLFDGEQAAAATGDFSYQRPSEKPKAAPAPSAAAGEEEERRRKK
jgi:hypothetical protein